MLACHFSHLIDFVCVLNEDMGTYSGKGFFELRCSTIYPSCSSFFLQRIQYRKLMSGAIKKDGEVSFAEEDDGDESKGDDEISFRLTDDRRKRLEEVGFVWNVRENDKGGEVGRITRNSYDDQWDTMFQLLEEYKQRNGVSRILPDFVMSHAIAHISVSSI